MLIPEKIEVAGHTFSVVLKDDPKKPNEMGCIHFNTCVIRISQNISATQKEATLLHEILEAVNSIHRVDLRHKQIEQLEAGLYPALKDNNLWINSR